MSEIFNVSTNPHVRSKDTTQTIMRDVLIALAPASIFGIYNFGVQALIRIIVGIAVCMASEAVYEYFMHKKITVMDLSAAVTGLSLIHISSSGLIASISSVHIVHLMCVCLIESRLSHI